MTSGPPFFFWINRYQPYFVGSMQTASSGRIAVVRCPVGSIGRPMTVAFRMVDAAQLETWQGTTGIFTMFSKSVIWAPANPLTYENELIKDYDPGTIDRTGDKAGFNYFRGTMNLVIVR